MQRRQTYRNVTSHISVSLMIILVSISLPLLNIDGYMKALNDFHIVMPDFVNFRLIILIGIMVNGLFGTIINYNVLKVIYKIKNYPIKNKYLLSQYALSFFFLSIIEVFIVHFKINLSWMIKNFILFTFVYFIVFFFYNQLYQIENKKHGIYATLIFCLVNLLLSLVSFGFITMG